MAKSKAFFGLRRGSTKSHTYQVYRGEQVTKDRVTKVANPQTSKQGAQRLRLAMVANAAARLEGLVNHSFEGKQYGAISVGEFRRLNLVSNGPCHITSYVPKDYADPGMAEYIISNGSLPTIATNMLVDSPAIMLECAIANDNLVLEQKPDNIQSAFNKAVEAIRIALGFEIGDQLSFIVQVYDKDQSFMYNDKTYSFPRTKFFQISRLEFVEEVNSTAASNIVGGANNGWTFAQIRDNNSPNFGKWALSNGYFIIYPDDENKNLVFSAAINPNIGNNGNILSGAFIHSRREGDKWMRSRQQLVLNDGFETLSGEDAWRTYLKATTSSSKYLNTGETAPNIIGQNTVKLDPFDN